MTAYYAALDETSKTTEDAAHSSTTSVSPTGGKMQHGADAGAAIGLSRSSPPACRTGCSTSATRRSATSPRRLRYESVGDLDETIALLVPAKAAKWTSRSRLGRRTAAAWLVDSRRRHSVTTGRGWDRLDSMTRFVCGKLITGAFRVGVSRLLVTRSLGAVAQVDPKRIAERLVGYTDLSNRPDAAQFLRLIASDDPGDPRQVETDRHAALPVLSRAGTAGGGSGPRGAARPDRRLAGRVEVGRHPGAGASSRRAGRGLVARRGPDHRAVSGARGTRRAAPGRDGPRRRDRRMPRWCRASVRIAAATARPETAVGTVAGGTAGRPDRIRPDRGRWRRPAQSGPGRTPIGARGAGGAMPRRRSVARAGAPTVAARRGGRLAGARPAAPGVAQAGRRRPDAEVAPLSRYGVGRTRRPGPGGNGRSTRSASMRY